MECIFLRQRTTVLKTCCASVLLFCQPLQWITNVLMCAHIRWLLLMSPSFTCGRQGSCESPGIPKWLDNSSGKASMSVLSYPEEIECSPCCAFIYNNGLSINQTMDATRPVIPSGFFFLLLILGLGPNDLSVSWGTCCCFFEGCWRVLQVPCPHPVDRKQLHGHNQLGVDGPPSVWLLAWWFQTKAKIRGGRSWIQPPCMSVCVCLYSLAWICWPHLLQSDHKTTQLRSLPTCEPFWLLSWLCWWWCAAIGGAHYPLHLNNRFLEGSNCRSLPGLISSITWRSGFWGGQVQDKYLPIPSHLGGSPKAPRGLLQGVLAWTLPSPHTFHNWGVSVSPSHAAWELLAGLVMISFYLMVDP